MNSPINQIDERLSEQLCAYMDGELPADEVRFLERRLANEPALRAKWERMQLASACVKGQPFMPADARLSNRIAEALAVPAANRRQPWQLWATAASVAVLALAFAPRLLHFGSGSPEAGMAVPMLASKASARPTASPANADFVAIESAPSEVATPVNTTARPKPVPASGDINAAPRVASASDSPTQFPLVESGASKSWPRAELPGAGNDPSIEAYLVRHNQMLANDGLGGFVPYVDVVTNDPTPTSDGGDDSQ